MFTLQTNVIISQSTIHSSNNPNFASYRPFVSLCVFLVSFPSTSDFHDLIFSFFFFFWWRGRWGGRVRTNNIVKRRKGAVGRFFRQKGRHNVGLQVLAVAAVGGPTI